MSEFNSYDALQTARIDGLPIFKVGKWNGDFYSLQDLQNMVAAFHSLSFAPTVKAGHEDGQDSEEKARRVFGEPSLGVVKDLYISSGDTLYADLYRIPAKFARLIEAGAYRRVSAEIYWQYRDEASGKTYPRVLKSVAFLGAELPCIATLDEVSNLYYDGDTEAAVGYDSRGRQFRVYIFQNESGEENEMENENHTYTRPGDELAARAKIYSEQTGVTLSAATRHVLREDPELAANYHQSGARADYADIADGSAATRTINNVCASFARPSEPIDPELYQSVLDAVVAAVPVELRQQAAGQKLDQLARKEIGNRGAANLISLSYSQILRAVGRQYPGLAQMYQGGNVTVDALRDLLPKGADLFGVE